MESEGSVSFSVRSAFFVFRVGKTCVCFVRFLDVAPCVFPDGFPESLQTDIATMSHRDILSFFLVGEEPNRAPRQGAPGNFSR